jgi:hypothetical protein
VYPAGKGTGELDAAGLPSTASPDADADDDADADGVAVAVGFAVTVAVLHDVTATVITKTTGSARPTTRMRNFAAFPG